MPRYVKYTDLDIHGYKFPDVIGVYLYIVGN